MFLTYSLLFISTSGCWVTEKVAYGGDGCFSELIEIHVFICLNIFLLITQPGQVTIGNKMSKKQRRLVPWHMLTGLVQPFSFRCHTHTPPEHLK